MNNIELAYNYFKLSNESNMIEIEKLFKESITYSSKNTGLYFGINNIIEMQKSFHWSFKKLEWKMHSIEEIKPWIILIDYEFNWLKDTWEKVIDSWLEYIIIHNEKIQHIEIKNK